MISELRKGKSEITIKYFKSDSKDNDEEDKDNNRSDSEFKFDKASKDYYDMFYQQSVESSKDENLLIVIIQIITILISLLFLMSKFLHFYLHNIEEPKQM